MYEDFDAIDITAIETIPSAYNTAAALPSPAALTKGSAPSPVCVLLEFDAYVSGNVTTQRYSDRGIICPDNTRYPPRLLSRVTVAQSAIDAIGIGGRIASTSVVLKLANYDNALDSIMEDDSALGRSAIIRTLPAPTPSLSDCGGGNVSQSSLLFTGVIASMAPDGAGCVQIEIADQSERLNVPLQSNLYDGLGGTGGAPERAGQPKPVSFGYRFNISPVYIGLVDFGDGAKPTYQYHWREAFGATAMRERGVPMDKVDTAPSIGEWRDWALYGCFQIGFTADGIVTCDCQGDAPSGAYASSASDIVSRALTSLGAGLSASDLDAASFALAAIALPGEQGWGTSAAISHGAALDEMLGHFGLWLSGGRDGKLRLSLSTQSLSAAQGTIGTYNIAALKPMPLPAELSPAPYAIEIVADRNWTPLTDIAGSVTGTERDRLAGAGTVYRSVSSALQTRQKPQRPWPLGGLYRYGAYAQARADALRTFVESGPKGFEVEIDRFRNQVNIGDVLTVDLYTRYGLSGGFTGLVAAWREEPIPGRLTVTLIG